MAVVRHKTYKFPTLNRSFNAKLLILLLLLTVFGEFGCSQTYTRDSELLDSIFVNYDNRLAPSYSSTTNDVARDRNRNNGLTTTDTGRPAAIDVRARVIVHALVRICEQCQTCTFDITIEQEWLDTRLSYSAALLPAGQSAVSVPSNDPNNKLWTPRMQFRSSVLTNDHSERAVNSAQETSISIRPDGTLMRTERAVHTVECRFDYENFPADATLVELELTGNSSTTPVRLVSFPNDDDATLSSSNKPPAITYNVRRDYRNSLSNHNSSSLAVERSDQNQIKSMVTEFRVVRLADHGDDELSEAESLNEARRDTVFVNNTETAQGRNNSRIKPVSLTNTALVAQPSSAVIRANNNHTWSSSLSTYIVRLKIIRQSEIYCWNLYVPTFALCLIGWLFLLWRRGDSGRRHRHHRITKQQHKIHYNGTAGNSAAAQHNYYGHRTVNNGGGDGSASSAVIYNDSARRDRLILHCLIILLTAGIAAYALQAVPGTPYLKTIHYWLAGVFAFEFATLLLGATRVLDCGSDDGEEEVAESDNQQEQRTEQTNEKTAKIVSGKQARRQKNVSSAAESGTYYAPVSIVPPLSAGNRSLKDPVELLHENNGTKRVMCVAQHSASKTTTTTTVVSRIAPAASPPPLADEQNYDVTERSAMLSTSAREGEEPVEELDARVDENGAAQESGRAKKKTAGAKQQAPRRHGSLWGVAAGCGMAFGLLLVFLAFVATYVIIVHGFK